jgi:AhpC/TSA family
LAQRLETGQRAPHFSLLAAGSGRRVDLKGLAGHKVVLIFHLQGTAPTAREINRAVRARYPDPDEVLVASVIDLSIVPPFYWMSVGLILNQAYDGAAGELPPDADYVVILPDWGGLVSRDYGVKNTGRAAAIVVLDESSNVAASYQGERPMEAVLGMIART